MSERTFRKTFEVREPAIKQRGGLIAFISNGGPTPSSRMFKKKRAEYNNSSTNKAVKCLVDLTETTE